MITANNINKDSILLGMARKGQSQVDLLFGITILIVGSSLVIMWSFGEAFAIPALRTLALWGLGLFAIVIEMIRVVVRGGFD